ncbi:Golgi transport complex subunit 3 [Malassezia psittaci]|uniref:Conserved oligomeric Golgi complex subunit 3 n=1 Tax=Malassezia psittaci TaxID=1821823 RepID=A0AAF0JDS4_9BASI|nr:Golgi transport complex subunit 3 [Malassezia psittaci]
MSAGESSSDAAFSLEDWYANVAPLTETQRLSVSRISAWTSRPIEKEDAIEPNPPKDTWTIANRMESLAEDVDSMDAKLYDSRIQTVENMVGKLDELLQLVEAAQTDLGQLQDALSFVEGHARDFLAKANTMLTDQHQVDVLREEVALRLSYFSVLPQATALASMSTSNVLDEPAFLDTLKRLELALQFMNTHKNYIDAHLYQMRLAHCVVRILEMIRTQFTKQGALRTEAAIAQLQEANQTRDYSSDTGRLTLDSSLITEALFDSFRADQQKLRPYFAQIESMGPTVKIASPAAASELEKEFEECRKTLVRWRKVLSGEFLQMYLSDHSLRINNDKQYDLKTAVLDASMLAQGLAFREVFFYHKYFRISQSKNDSECNAALVDLLYAFGADFGKFIAPFLPKDAQLADLIDMTDCVRQGTKIAKADIVSAEDMAEGFDTAQYYTIAVSWSEPVLNELGSRIVSSAQSVITRDIIQFTPSHEDLMYPACLYDNREELFEEQRALVHSTKSKVLQHTKRNSVIGVGLLESLVSKDPADTSMFSRPSESVFASWYKPIRTALDLLATLHTRIPLTFLVELGMRIIQSAQDAVAHGASLLLQGKFGSEDGGVGAVDGYLFELRHLFVLRELYYSVEIAYRGTKDGDHHRNIPYDTRPSSSPGQAFGVRMPDVSLVLDTIHSVWGSTRLLSRSEPQSSSSTQGSKETNQATPSVMHSTYTQLQARIEETKEKVIGLAASTFALPLQIFVAQTEKENVQTIAPTKALAAWSTFQQGLEVNSVNLQEKLPMYISDEATIQEVVDGTVAKIIATFNVYKANVLEGVSRCNPSEVPKELSSLVPSSDLHELLKRRLLPASDLMRNTS